MSSLVFLGFSIIMFVISYGLCWYLVPIILGTFFSIDIPIADSDWQAVKDSNEAKIRWLIPLVPTIGIMVLVIKVLMVSTARGRD